VSKTGIVSACGVGDSARAHPFLDWHVLAALLLALATWFAGQPEVRFSAIADPLVVSHENWRVIHSASIERLEDNALIVRSGNNRRGRALAEIDIGESTTDRYWNIDLVVERLSKRDGLSLQANARVVLGWLKDGERTGWAPTQLLSPFGNVTRVDTVIRVPPGANGVRVGFVVPRAGSEWQLSAPRLLPVVQAPFVNAAPIVLAVLWTVLLLSLLSRAVRRASRWRPGAVMLGLLIVVVGAGASREMMAQFVKPLIFLGSSVFGVSAGWASLLIQKGGHFAAFMLLTVALLSARTVLALRTGSILIFCIAMAVVTESLQLYVVGRSPRLIDLVIDFAGIVTGFVCFLSWQAWRRRDRSPAV